MMRNHVAVAALFVLISCSTVFANPSDTIPWLTGNFEVVDSIPGGNPYFRFPPPYGTMNFVPPADLPYTSGCFSCGTQYEEDWFSYYGSVVGGSMTMLARFQDTDPNLSFTGWMTGGQITGYTQTVCPVCIGDPVNDWTYDVTFRGIWSNGWWSEGTAQVTTAYVMGPGGYVNMTTSTPEPGTLLTLASGILALTGMARKKLFG